MIDDELLRRLAEAASLLIDYFDIPTNALGAWLIATGVIIGAYFLTPFIQL